MARARNIKPGFFRNADLVEMPIEARLLFIGLWTLADRSGRLEDRPRQIKMDIFPADSVDVDACLNLIAATGMLTRYESGGKRCIQITNFSKHQNPHRDEKASTLPDLDGNTAESDHEQEKHSASTVQARCKGSAATMAIGLNPESRSLNPESGSLNPDSLIPEKNIGRHARASRLPTNHALNDQWIDFCKTERPDLDPELTFATFRDYWIAKPGKEGCKLDWLATWRNWVRSQHQRAPPSATPRAAVLSFKEQDRQAGRKRWEEMTGEVHPDSARVLDVFDVFDATPRALVGVKA